MKTFVGILCLIGAIAISQEKGLVAGLTFLIACGLFASIVTFIVGDRDRADIKNRIITHLECQFPEIDIVDYGHELSDPSTEVNLEIYFSRTPGELINSIKDLFGLLGYTIVSSPVDAPVKDLLDSFAVELPENGMLCVMIASTKKSSICYIVRAGLYR